MEVLVFKTNLSSALCIDTMKPHLDTHPHIHRWNVDLHDCDNILRIETERLQAGDIKNILLQEGYYCEELQ